MEQQWWFKFPCYIRIFEIFIYIEIIASQTLFIVWSVLNLLFIYGAGGEYRTQVLKHVIKNICVATFHRLTNQTLCYYSYWFKMIIIILSLQPQSPSEVLLRLQAIHYTYWRIDHTWYVTHMYIIKQLMEKFHRAQCFRHGTSQVF